MSGTGRWFVVLLSVLLAVPAAAQDDNGPDGFVYSTYYICDQATQGNMDSLVEANEVPVFNKLVKDGKLLSWGYLAHFTGGKWRRAQYHVAPTLEGAFAAQLEVSASAYTDDREAGLARAEACPGHDDYIWSTTQGSPPGTDRGDVSLSVYFECSVADQARADEIFAEVFAPGLDQHVEEGNLASWGWLSHVLGGEYRRLQTLTGSDYASVAAIRLGVLRDVGSEHPALAREFAEICHTHVDYLWDIVHEAP